MVNQRFLLLFAATITLVVVTIRVGDAAFSTGGALATGGLLVAGALAAIGLLALVRSVYADSRKDVRRNNRGRA